MAPTFQLSAQSINASSTNQASVLPAGIQAGELLFAHIFYRNASALTAPANVSGWNLILTTNNSTVMTQSIWYKIAGASETTAPTWTLGTAAVCLIMISRYAGVDTTTPINGTPVSITTTGGSAASLTLPALTTTVDDATYLVLGSSSVNANWTQITGMTERYDSPNGNAGSAKTQAMDDEVRATAGSTGTRVMTCASSGIMQVQGVALAPSVAQTFSFLPPTDTVQRILMRR